MIASKLEENEVSLNLHPEIYGEDSLRVAAQVISNRAEAFVEEGPRGARTVTLVPRRPAKKEEDLDRLGGEFLNEALNQEYRKLVGGLNKNLSAMLVTQALYSARGGESPPSAPKLTAEQEKEVEKLLAETREEIKRTMPKRIPPQGTPIPLAEEDK